MKFPWTKRIDERTEEAQQHASEAEHEEWRVKSQWPQALRAAHEVRPERFDGWTDTVTKIFGGHA